MKRRLPRILATGSLMTIVYWGFGTTARFSDPEFRGSTRDDSSKMAWNIAWYNVENLFDCEDDPDVRDEDFLPESSKEYAPRYYRIKVQRVAKVLGWLLNSTGSVAVGLCEVENGRVLDDLIAVLPSECGEVWRVHRNSPDPRGIDVAVLYRADSVAVENVHWLHPSLEADFNTREAVVLTLVRRRAPFDSLRVGWVHLPSQRSGESTVRARTWSSIQRNAPGAEVWLGDVNEPPGWALDEAVLARGYKAIQLKGAGTYFYREAWSWLDRGWTSSAWEASATVRALPWMGSGPIDVRSGGSAPWRTWQGDRWVGGPSDHYPIHVRLMRV